jgi:nucleoid-associated protein YgaU
MAQNAYDEGDYDSSEQYASEAVRYAQLSDEYVVQQLKIKEANDAIAVAKQRLDWAASSGASNAYPAEYAKAQGFYQNSLTARRAEEWDTAIEAANNVINVLAYVRAPSASSPAATVALPDNRNLPDDSKALPARYTVRSWESSKDCLWNIAGRSWAYGDSFKWKLIFDANKDKMPDANNPDLINPGMVLDIPSIKGEVRQGMWEAGKSY